MKFRFSMFLLAVALVSAGVTTCSVAKAELIYRFVDRFDDVKGRTWPWSYWQDKKVCFVSDSLPEFKRQIVRKAAATWRAALPGVRLTECPDDFDYSGASGDVWEDSVLDKYSWLGDTAAVGAVFFHEYSSYQESVPNEGSPDYFNLVMRKKLPDTILGEGKTLYWGTQTPPKGYSDAWSVLTHEFGHVLGIGHPNDLEAEKYCNYKLLLDRTATMCGRTFTGKTFARTLSPFDVSQLRLSINRSRTNPLKTQQRNVAQIMWLEPTEETWKSKANQVFVGKVVSIGESFRSSKVKPPEPIGVISRQEFKERIRWGGMRLREITLKVEQPVRGVQKNETITLTHYDEDLNFKVGDERLFFLKNNSKLWLIEKPGLARSVKVTVFAGSPKASVFVRSQARTDLFENEYKKFTLDELR